MILSAIVVGYEPSVRYEPSILQVYNSLWVSFATGGGSNAVFVAAIAHVSFGLKRWYQTHLFSESFSSVHWAEDDSQNPLCWNLQLASDLLALLFVQWPCLGLRFLMSWPPLFLFFRLGLHLRYVEVQPLQEWLDGDLTFPEGPCHFQHGEGRQRLMQEFDWQGLLD